MCRARDRQVWVDNRSRSHQAGRNDPRLQLPVGVIKDRRRRHLAAGACCRRDQNVRHATCWKDLDTEVLRHRAVICSADRNTLRGIEGTAPAHTNDGVIRPAIGCAGLPRIKRHLDRRHRRFGWNPVIDAGDDPGCLDEVADPTGYTRRTHTGIGHQKHPTCTQPADLYRHLHYGPGTERHRRQTQRDWKVKWTVNKWQQQSCLLGAASHVGTRIRGGSPPPCNAVPQSFGHPKPCPSERPVPLPAPGGGVGGPGESGVGAGSYAMGSHTVNTAPDPGRFATATVPLCASTSVRTIARPSPLPPGDRAWSTR